jgi:hypothetical protein
MHLKRGSTMVLVFSPLIPEPNLKPDSPNDLDFYFFPFSGGFFDNKIQYAEAKITNRSDKKMHLELWAHVDYWKDNGEPNRTGGRAEWNPDETKEHTGDDFIELEPGETKKGRIMITLMETKGLGIDKWFVDVSEDVYIEVYDTVSGKRNAFKAMSGYPRGQTEAPLVPVKEHLDLDFPRSTAVSQSAIETLELILRTSDMSFIYDPAEKQFRVMAWNRSADPMDLSFNLLVCDPPQSNAWTLCEGSVEFIKDLPYQSSVTVEPGDSLLKYVKFDLGGIAKNKPEYWQPGESPKESLLEIHDRVSGKTVWCALQSGYPPGTDMRPFTIKRNNFPVSDNPPLDAPNTP